VVDPWYVAGALAVAFAITLSLRALPFAVLKPLRRSRLVMALGLWMPVGILGILAASTFVDTASVDWSTAWKAVVAVSVTAAVHLLGGRRTLLSIGLGTLTFVALVNLL
jgi:branched-subunit amino acid transport protein AzlD